jgi:hypothetical protein
MAKPKPMYCVACNTTDLLRIGFLMCFTTFASSATQLFTMVLATTGSPVSQFLSDGSFVISPRTTLAIAS